MMKGCLAVILFFSLVLFFPNRAQAEEADGSAGTSGLSGLALIGLTEGFFAVNSGLATLSPRVYGGAGLLLLPLGLAQGGSSKGNIVAASLFAGLCVYNLVVPERQDLSNSEVFVHNMIGWHVLALGVGAVSFLTPEQDEKTQQALRFDIRLGSAGPMLIAQYRF